MQERQNFQVGLLTLTSPGKWVPAPRAIRETTRIADEASGKMDAVLEAMYSTIG